MTNPSTEIVRVGEETPLTLGEVRDNVLYLVDQFATAWKRTLVDAVELGQALIELKAMTPHGEWLPWLEDNFPLGVAMAERFMKMGRNSSEMLNLPADTPITAAMKMLQAKRREARPLRPVTIDATVPDRPLLRFCGPDWSTGAIVKSIVLVAFPEARTILDVTYGLGNFWSEGAPVPVTAHDLAPERAPNGVMDYTDLQYDDATWDVVTLDPRHLANGGEDSVMTNRFGTAATQEEIDNQIIDGTRECWRVCSMGLIVKVTNHVHAATFQYEQGLVEEALDWKIPYYDLVYQVRDHAFIDPTWGPQKSAYNNGSVYIILKKGSQLHR